MAWSPEGVWLGAPGPRTVDVLVRRRSDSPLPISPGATAGPSAGQQCSCFGLAIYFIERGGWFGLTIAAARDSPFLFVRDEIPSPDLPHFFDADLDLAAGRASLAFRVLAPDTAICCDSCESGLAGRYLATPKTGFYFHGNRQGRVLQSMSATRCCGSKLRQPRPARAPDPAVVQFLDSHLDLVRGAAAIPLSGVRETGLSLKLSPTEAKWRDGVYRCSVSAVTGPSNHRAIDGVPTAPSNRGF
jgi:hypothetical protein